MKTHTNEEILKACQAIWDAQHKKHYMMGWEGDGCIEIKKNTPELVQMKFKCMYEAPVLNLEVLRQLAEFFETDNINDDDRFGYGGCETCDYGSRYGFTLSIRPGKVQPFAHILGNQSGMDAA